MTTAFVYLSLYECSRADCTIPLIMAKNKLMVPWPDEESSALTTFLTPSGSFQWISLPTGAANLPAYFTDYQGIIH